MGLHGVLVGDRGDAAGDVRRVRALPALETVYDEPVFDEELDFYDGQAARALFAEVAQESPGYQFTADTPRCHRPSRPNCSE